ncbi:MAG: ATP-binding protein [Actinomycetota bacterium]|nr:ATP-binding protein [Actinomycetota bacterium]
MRAEFSRAGIDGAVTFDCLVAVTEACSNALIHGCGANEEQHAVVSWQVDQTCLSFFIQDFGGREWAKTAHPSRAEPRESSAAGGRIGGYGLGLMEGLMDQVEIGFRSGGTTVTMVKDLAVPVTS